MNPAETVHSCPLNDWAWLVKASICSIQRKRPLSDFNRNADGQKKSPDSHALFTWASELKQRSHRKQDCGVYRGDTDNCRAGLGGRGVNCSFLPELKRSRGKENTLHSESGELPFCFQTQMVPLTLASFIRLGWKTATWFELMVMF